MSSSVHKKSKKKKKKKKKKFSSWKWTNTKVRTHANGRKNLFY